MNDADSKKLEQLIVMLADMGASVADRFDTIDEQLAKQDRRLDTIADRLLALEKKASGIDRRLDERRSGL